jgi:glycosyltransferase involved in cell wall biosynthesis
VAGLKEEDALVKLVKKIRNEENLEELNIRLMGTLSADDLVKNLLQADIYVQVSHIENSPNSLCEAMLAGIPIIASFAGGTSSLLQDRIHGVLVQNGDPYALAGGLIEITQDPENFVRMARTAYQAAHARHDAHTVVQQLMTAYTDIIREHHAQHNSNAPLPQPISINK